MGRILQLNPRPARWGEKAAYDRSKVGRDHLATTIEALHADVNRVQAENARLAARLETAERLIRELHEAYEDRPLEFHLHGEIAELNGTHTNPRSP